MRYLTSLTLVFILVFIIWPYYHLYRLDNALSSPSSTALAGLIDVQAIRDNTRNRIKWMLGLKERMNSNDPIGWLQQGLQRAGEAALEETINQEWVQRELRDAVTTAVDKRPAYLLAAVEFAMFEGWDSFIVRLGRLGYRDTHLRLRLEGMTWKVTDIVR